MGSWQQKTDLQIALNKVQNNLICCLIYEESRKALQTPELILLDWILLSWLNQHPND